jgi:3'-5' exoribonuclease
MNSLPTFIATFSDEVVVANHLTPAHLAMMPRLFRLASIQHTPLDGARTRCTASLYHDQASLKVSWIVNQPDLRLKSGDLVSPRWPGCTTSEAGMIKISRLILIERPEPWENLFHTIPHGWVKNREMIKQAAVLVDALPRAYRFLFNAIFWERTPCRG